jgi:hypothetical protein
VKSALAHEALPLASPGPILHRAAFHLSYISAFCFLLSVFDLAAFPISAFHLAALSG